MATINEITGAAGYTGNAALGGYISTAIDIDTKPVDALAAYTVAQNQAYYNQRLKDADNVLEQLAAITQYDWTTAVGKDKEEALRVYTEAVNAAKEYAKLGATSDPKKKLEREIQFRGVLDGALTKLNKLTKRGLSYQTQLNAINQAPTSAAQKDLYIAELNKLVENTSWDEDIPTLPQFQIDLPKAVEPKYTETEMNYSVGNRNYKTKIKFVNQRSIYNQAQVYELELEKPLPDNATPNEIAEYEMRKAILGTNTPVDMAKNLNDVLNQFRNADGTINEQALYQSGNSIAIKNYEIIKDWNRYADDGLRALQQNQFVTRNGRTIYNIRSVVNPDIFVKIDLSKPITAKDLIAVQSFANATPDSKEETFTFTGEELQYAELDLRRQQERRLASHGGGGRDVGGIITQPVDAYTNTVVSRAEYKRANKGERYQVLPYIAVDEMTRVATGIKEGEFIQFDLDKGGYNIVKMSPTGMKRYRGGTETDLQKRINEYYKSSQRDEEGNVLGGEQAEGFVKSIENGYRTQYGTTNAGLIYRNVFNQILNENNQQATTPNTQQGQGGFDLNSFLNRKGINPQ